MVISSFKVFDTEIPGIQTQKLIDLSYDENFFSFEFSTIKTHPGRLVQYAYMLKGFDKKWIIAGTNNRASYTNVPGGKYTFLVKATNAAGFWSDAPLDRKSTRLNSSHG